MMYINQATLLKKLEESETRVQRYVYILSQLAHCNTAKEYEQLLPWIISSSYVQKRA